MKEDRFNFYHLDRAGRILARAAHSSKFLVYGLAALLVAISWLALLSMSSRIPAGQAGPGAGVMGLLPDPVFLPGLDWMISTCLTPISFRAMEIQQFFALVLMWFLMSVAMMLPSAAPLLRTYCEIADTARASGKTVVHPFWLVFGYLCVWLSAAVCFAGVNVAMSAMGKGEGMVSPAAGPVSAAVLVLAGAYQFSGLKDACLTKCQNPFPTLFANWSFSARPIFKLGAMQGVWCLGCCWALMLVMFSVGVMNVLWMALLCAFTAIEKSGKGNALSRTGGAILLVWAFGVLLISFDFV